VSDITISIVTAVLDSPEVVRRQVLWYRQMPLPEDVEWIVVDDKSLPPLRQEDYDLPRFRILRYDRPVAWSQPAARNLGCRAATGKWLLCTDIDHIVPLSLINFIRDCPHHFIKFKREVAVLTEEGTFDQSEEAVLRYGFLPEKLAQGGFHISPHTNSFGIHRDLYLRLGGVSEQHVGSGRHPNREELPLRRRVRRAAEAGEITMLTEDTDGEDQRPLIYMIPNGRYCGDDNYNPFGLFHNLKRRSTVVWREDRAHVTSGL
jgi:hypothetical protein